MPQDNVVYLDEHRLGQEDPDYDRVFGPTRPFGLVPSQAPALRKPLLGRVLSGFARMASQSMQHFSPKGW